MDQNKIGKFITELRKGKNMTQQELANKIGVTDRAISKWENGRGMPDLSLMKPLCDELEITINELLSGEKIAAKDYQEKSEKTLLNTIDYTSKKIKKRTKIFKYFFSLIILLILTFITLFFIDVNRMNKNKPVFFSTWGFCYTPAIDLHEVEIEFAIKEYLIEKNDNESKHHEEEKSFVSFRTYLIEEKEDNKVYNIYAWVIEETYYLENDEFKQDSGSSLPYKFVVEKINEEFRITDSRIPRDGSLYDEDMKNIFPKSVRKDMENVYLDGTSERLKLDIHEQVKLYFHEK